MDMTAQSIAQAKAAQVYEREQVFRATGIRISDEGKTMTTKNEEVLPHWETQANSTDIPTASAVAPTANVQTRVASFEDYVVRLVAERDALKAFVEKVAQMQRCDDEAHACVHDSGPYCQTHDYWPFALIVEARALLTGEGQ